MFEIYFQLAVQAICLARMFHCFGEVSPYVCFRLTESLVSAPNSTYTSGIGKFNIPDNLSVKLTVIASVSTTDSRGIFASFASGFKLVQTGSCVGYCVSSHSLEIKSYTEWLDNNAEKMKLLHKLD